MGQIINRELHSYIDVLNDQQKEAVLSVVKVLAAEPAEELWEDAGFVAEVQKHYTTASAHGLGIGFSQKQ